MAATALGALVALALTLPLAWKWQLGVRLCAAGIVLLAIAAGLVVAPLGLGVILGGAVICALTIAAAVALTAYRFFRDPERTPPAGDDVLVSPADGEVVYVREARGGVVPMSTKQGRDYTLEELTRTRLRSEDAVVIGISMNLLDVHVNRAPIEGRVALRKHFPGLFGSLRLQEMILQNERATTVIERGSLQIAVVQIASRLVRQITSYVQEGETVAAGQRIGAIRFGSQVDVVVAADEALEVAVRPGMKVRAGETVLARLR
jgi:phosphatidylserine decarboxylase